MGAAGEPGVGRPPLGAGRPYVRIGLGGGHGNPMGHHGNRSGRAVSGPERRHNHRAAKGHDRQNELHGHIVKVGMGAGPVQYAIPSFKERAPLNPFAFRQSCGAGNSDSGE